jgi:hypothetical protein
MRAAALQLLQKLAGITELELRVQLLVEQLRQVTREEAATLIAELMRWAPGHPAGRGLQVALAIALGEPTLQGQVSEEIRREARDRGDARVSGLLTRRGSYVDVTKATLPPPPPGSPSRELSLGERRSLARRPDRNSLEKLLLDPEPLVIRNLLHNPRLTEDDVLRLASRRPGRPEVLAEIYASRRWVCRSRIQLALILNPYNRSEIGLRLVPLLTGEALEQVARESNIDPVISHSARATLRGRE